MGFPCILIHKRDKKLWQHRRWCIHVLLNSVPAHRRGVNSVHPILLDLVFNYACKDFSCEYFLPINSLWVSEDEISLISFPGLFLRGLGENRPWEHDILFFFPLCPIESYILVQFDFIRKFWLEVLFGGFGLIVSKAVKGKKNTGQK